MRKMLACLLILLAVVVFAEEKKKTYKVTGYVGKSSSQVASGVSVILIDKDSEEVIGTASTNFMGKYTIKDVPPGVYVLQVEHVNRTLGVKDKNVRLDIDLSAEAGIMDYAKTGVEMINKEKALNGKNAPKKGGDTGSQAAGNAENPGGAGGATSPDLMKYFAGEYYSYSSGSSIYGGAGTERKVTLCSNGFYRDSSEFSASGSDWGAVNAQGSSASWAVQGDKSQGTIVVTYADGRTKQFGYRIVSKEDQTIAFDGVKFAFSGVPQCP